MAPDDRTYIKLHDGMVEHPKTEQVGGDAGWLHICAMSYCSRFSTDGAFPASKVGRLSDRKQPERLATRLLAAGLWHAPGHTCERCVQPAEGEYVVHDYLEHQRSAGEIATLRDKRRDAGRRGGTSTANSKPEPSTAEANAKQVLEQESEQELEQRDGKTQAVSVLEVFPNGKTPAAPPRPDVDQLCQTLREAMIGNGCKPPRVAASWREAARLLLDSDKRPLDEAMRVLAFSQQDQFWRGNVQSMPTFRKQYDRIRLKAGVAVRPAVDRQTAWARR